MDNLILEAKGFKPFECDDTVLYEKGFLEIGYTLCTSDNGTFSISTYSEGDVITKLPLAKILDVDAAFTAAEVVIKTFKADLTEVINSFAKKKSEGSNEDA